MTAAGITSYFAWKHLSQDDPDSKVVIGLLTSTLVALLFALSGTELIRNVRKIGPSGIEFSVWQEIARIPELAEPPRPHFDMESNPWGNRELSSKQLWFYERGSQLLSHLSRLGVSADELEGGELRRYRRIVLWVGIAALNEGERHKAFEILKTVENLRDLSSDELYFLGTAYLWVALKEADPASQAEKLDRSEELLERAVKARPGQAHMHWALGYVYYQLKLYTESIAENEEAIKLSSKHFLPWASWMLAAIYLHLEDRPAALTALADIRPGDWWGEMWEDDDLDALRDDLRFQTLAAPSLLD